jgi:hypothetical protein
VSLAIAEPPVHVHPVSTAHEASQPSPVRRLASSHAKFPSLNPSPHSSFHVSPAWAAPPVHRYLASVTQVELHPSPFTTFPSSQVCQPMFLLSPHISLQVVTSQGEPPSHSHPISVLQLLSHPSLLFRLPVITLIIEKVSTVTSFFISYRRVSDITPCSDKAIFNSTESITSFTTSDVAVVASYFL